MNTRNTTSHKNFLIPFLVLVAATTYSCDKDSEKFKSLQRDADMAYAKQDLNGALSLYSQALKMDSDSTKTMIMLGKIHYYKRNFEKAEEMFEDAVNKDQCNANAAYWLSRVQSLQKENRTEVKESLQSIINRIPDRWEVQYTLGAVLESEGKIPEALSLYDQAKAESAKLALVYLRLGKIYRKAQREDMADRYFQKAKFLSEENPSSFKMIESEINKIQ
ncbi:tetratricopeptide repeat protein [Leptospira weilii serovar Ranarum str. ICFT]|uniref:Tetratricopeptide repeat protein n=1 Tax=Leptospira weilii serovar Ranarum str. ICFT TaxID=1218598 RepID=N1W734_9LEPT|nr:tetratricopeptide repeat protein [Leptospira weilii]EMY76011.1 tetratricopeptide repeat protein [Leptospira weilii serovar Ranarum str. ICFT]